MTDAEEEATAGDWERESSQMANIFQSCQFTIYADISTSMDSGIFSQVPTEHHRLDAVGDDGKTSSVYIRRDVNRKSRTLLDSRGWTFQEYLLSPRTLHFGDFDITWRCKEKHVCECGPIMAGYGWHGVMARLSKPIPGDAKSIAEYWRNVDEYWNTVVFGSSPRILTNDDDKLAALSGVARRFYQQAGFTYLAGLWKQSLVRGLCWYIHQSLELSPASHFGMGTRPKRFRAPSWSWASVDNRNGATCCFWIRGSIYLHPFTPSCEPTPLCTVRDAFCQPKGKDPFGRVSGGYVDLSCMLIPATVEDIPNDHGLWKLANVADGTSVSLCFPDCKMAEVGLTSGDTVYCVPIGEGLFEARSLRGCLMLKQRDSRVPDEYERVGFCVLQKNHPHLTSDEIMSLKGNRGRLAAGEFAEMVKGHKFQVDPDTQTRIRIF